MKIDEIVNTLSTAYSREGDKDALKATFLYGAAIALNEMGWRKNISPLSPLINLFVINVLDSGRGKGFMISQVNRLFDFSNYRAKSNAVYARKCELFNEKPDFEVTKFFDDVYTSLDGTKQGMHDTAFSIDQLNGINSVNIMTEEFYSDVQSSTEILKKLKTAYDGDYLTGTIRGTRGELKKDSVYGVPTNFLGVTAPLAGSKSDQDIIGEIVTTGMGRRSLVTHSDETSLKYIPKDERSSISEISKYFRELMKKRRDETYHRLEDSTNPVNDDGKFTITFKHTDEALDAIDIIDEALVDRANANPFDKYKQDDAGSLNLIVNMAICIAFIEGDDILDESHVNHSFSFFLSSRENIKKAFQKPRGFEQMHKILSVEERLTQLEMINYDSKNVIPSAKRNFEEEVSLLRELCYYKGQRLHIDNGYVDRYSVKDMEKTQLSKIVLSVQAEQEYGKSHKTVLFEGIDFPWDDIAIMVRSEYIECFTLVHFEPRPSRSIDYGYRENKNAIEGQNCIGLDFDDGQMTIQEVKEKLQFYNYCLYTTKSNKVVSAKNPDGHERFRVILPTENKFYVSPENYKQMMINVEDFLGIVGNDAQTRNISRLWFTNVNAEVHINEADDCIDISACLPLTDAREKYIKKTMKEETGINACSIRTTNGQTKEYNGEASIENRVAGFMKKATESVNIGTLDDTLMRCVKFMKDLGLSKSEAEANLYEMCNIRSIPYRFAENKLKHYEK